MPRQEIDDLFLGNPYYITPDGELGREAYDVIQEAKLQSKSGCSPVGPNRYRSGTWRMS